MLLTDAEQYDYELLSPKFHQIETQCLCMLRPVNIICTESLIDIHQINITILNSADVILKKFQRMFRELSYTIIRVGLVLIALFEQGLHVLHGYKIIR
jgi:isoprenylcysteine carboxyl methyltransferase (ICMT) family protein YpbQ